MALDLPTVLDACHRLRTQQVRGVPTDARGQALLLSDWRSWEPTRDLERAELLALIDAHTAKGGKYMPTAHDFATLAAEARKVQRREAAIEQPSGEEGASARQAATFEDVVFGREWTQDGRRYRQYTIATRVGGYTGKHGPGMMSLARGDQGWRLLEEEMKANRGRSPDSIGLEWCGKMLFRPDPSTYAGRLNAPRRAVLGERRQ